MNFIFELTDIDGRMNYDFEYCMKKKKQNKAEWHSNRQERFQFHIPVEANVVSSIYTQIQSKSNY